MKIEDGLGSGRLAEVNSNHRLWTETVSHPTFHVQTLVEDKGASIDSGLITTSATAGEQEILRFKNTSTSLKFNPEHLFISTDAAAKFILRVYSGSTAPSANNTAGTAGNLLLSSTVTQPITTDVWDAVGTDGMTIASNGTRIFTFIIGANTIIPLFGSPVVTPATNLLFTIEPVTATAIKCAINVVGYFL